MMKFCSFCQQTGDLGNLASLEGLEFTDRHGWATPATEVINEILPEVTDATEICEECLQTICNFYQLKRDISLGIYKNSETAEQFAEIVKEEFEEFAISSNFHCESVDSSNTEGYSSSQKSATQSNTRRKSERKAAEKKAERCAELMAFKEEDEDELLVEMELPTGSYNYTLSDNDSSSDRELKPDREEVLMELQLTRNDRESMLKRMRIPLVFVTSETPQRDRKIEHSKVIARCFKTQYSIKKASGLEEDFEVWSMSDPRVMKQRKVEFSLQCANCKQLFKATTDDRSFTAFGSISLTFTHENSRKCFVFRNQFGLLPSTELETFKVMCEKNADDGFPCSICSQQQTSSLQTYRHMVFEHSKNKELLKKWIEQQIPKESGNSDLECSLCLKSSNSQQTLRNHLVSHILEGDVGDAELLALRCDLKVKEIRGNRPLTNAERSLRWRLEHPEVSRAVNKEQSKNYRAKLKNTASIDRILELRLKNNERQRRFRAKQKMLNKEKSKNYREKPKKTAPRDRISEMRMKNNERQKRFRAKQKMLRLAAKLESADEASK